MLDERLPLTAENADIEAFILAQLDKCGLGHNVFTEDAIALITRSSDGILRRIRNLALCHFVL